MPLELGAFSISLTVEDIDRSVAFYEKLGFAVTGGEDHWKILKNGDAMIGLFQGLFDKNILTFNPGLTNQMEAPEEFTDVREIQQRLQDAGLELVETVEPGTEGAASITLIDPDGNPILIDQFR